MLLFQLAADFFVFVFVQNVVLFVDDIGGKHAEEGENCQTEEHAGLLAAAYVGDNLVDPCQLGCFRNLSLIHLLLQSGNLIGISFDAEDDIDNGIDTDDNSGSELGDEGAGRADDGLAAFAELQLVVFYGIHDGNHHDQVIGIDSEVGNHVGCREDPALEVGIGAGHQKTDENHGQIAKAGYKEHNLHEGFPGNLLGQNRVNHHQNGSCSQTEGGEVGVIAAFIAEVKVNKERTEPSGRQIIANLLDNEGQGNPAKLVVVFDGIDDFPEGNRRRRGIIVAPVLAHAENGEAEEGRCEKADNERDPTKSIAGVAAQCSGAGGEHRNQETGNGPADTGEQVGAGSELVSPVRV